MTRLSEQTKRSLVECMTDEELYQLFVNRTHKTSPSFTGRGVYSYGVQLCADGITWRALPLDFCRAKDPIYMRGPTLKKARRRAEKLAVILTEEGSGYGFGCADMQDMEQ